MTGPLPTWAEERRYEYDLGMSTSCNYCGKTLGPIVFKDKLEQDKNSFYCSEECVWIAEEGDENL